MREAVPITDRPTLPTPVVVTRGLLGTESGYAVDTVTLPHENPDRALLFVSGLDFYARSDHVNPPGERTRGLCEASFLEYTQETEAHNRPGEFVTLHAYECSMGKPWGHHIVYFREGPGALVYAGAGLPALFAKLRKKGMKPFDKPREAMEFFVAQRVAEGQTDIPLEHLHQQLVAMRAREAAVAAGVYFVHLVGERFSATRKTVLVR